jgi:hypothetical protein
METTIDEITNGFRVWLTKRGHTANTVSNYTCATRSYLAVADNPWDQEVFDAYLETLTASRERLFNSSWRRFGDFLSTKYPHVILPTKKRGMAGRPRGNWNKHSKRFLAPPADTPPLAPEEGLGENDGLGHWEVYERSPKLPEPVLWAAARLKNSLGISPRQLARARWRDELRVPRCFLLIFNAWSQRGKAPASSDPVLAFEPGSSLAYPPKALGVAAGKFGLEHGSNRKIDYTHIRTIEDAMAAVFGDTKAKEVWFTLASTESATEAPPKSANPVSIFDGDIPMPGAIPDFAKSQ